MNHTDYLFTYLNEVQRRLSRLKAQGVKSQLCFDIDCIKLLRTNAWDLQASIAYKAMFDRLREIKGPVLYWFDITSPTDRGAIIAALRGYNNEAAARATPALKSIINFESDVLYVGQVKNHFSNHLLQHLGYSTVETTQGLQLLYWTQELDLQLRLNVLEFTEEMADLMSLVEYAMAQELRPLIGQHK